MNDGDLFVEEYRRMTPQQRELFQWLYNVTTNANGPIAVLFWGIAAGIATDEPEASFWAILGALKDTVTVQFYNDSGMD